MQWTVFALIMSGNTLLGTVDVCNDNHSYMEAYQEELKFENSQMEMDMRAKYGATDIKFFPMLIHNDFMRN